MTDIRRLAGYVRVKPRFSRSVSLERDFCTGGIDGYILTSLAKSTLERIRGGLSRSDGARAWSLTGPYGAGKSAFALFLAALLSDGSRKGYAHAALRDQDEELWKRLFDGRRSGSIADDRFLPVLATGVRGPVSRSLTRAMVNGLNASDSRHAKALAAKFEAIDRSSQIDERSLIQLIEDTTDDLARHGVASGLVIVLDEFGKHLQYVAQEPDRGDLFILQSLAELASRSPHPIVLITLLHQAFDQYAERLTALERSEWAKIQGRFEDVAFQETAEQSLRLLGHALEYTGPPADTSSWSTLANRLAEQAETLGLTSHDCTQALSSCFPLHPTVALTLGPLFKKIAQNERSLFAFLSAHEPNGFQDYAINQDWKPHLSVTYQLDRLYDYLVQALGPALLRSSQSRRWAETEAALQRTGADEFSSRVVKTVGLLHAIGNVTRLKPKLKMLAFALGSTLEQTSRTLNQLCEQSILIYRGFDESYGLWEGSDFDLESRLQEARLQVSLEESIADVLKRESPIRPMVARRHSAQTGTLRYFDVRYADYSDLDTIDLNVGEPDGILLYVFLASAKDRTPVERLLDQTRSRPDILVVLPDSAPLLRGYLHDLSCLRWLLSNTPELVGDAVARREIHARISSLQGVLRQYLERLLDDSLARGRWYHCGDEPAFALHSRRSLIEYLSQICDQVYPQTPVIANEIINRRNLSSAASAARKSLLEAMLTSSQVPGLGLSGHPPERSIYEAILRRSGVHGPNTNGDWGFGRPDASSCSNLENVWTAIDEKLGHSDLGRTSVGDLFETLQAAPFGMKSGVLPVLLCAYLLANDAEVAIYEDGAFIPLMTPAHYERLGRRPGKFAIQRYRVQGIRASVFDRLRTVFSVAHTKSEGDLLAIVRVLMRFVASLEPYAKVTHSSHLTNREVSVRRALLDARDPVKLMFQDLPQACGFPPLDANAIGSEQAQAFCDSLKEAVDTLRRSYPELLHSIEARIYSSLGVEAGGEAAREELADRARSLKGLAIDDHFKSVLLRLGNETLNTESWLESIATGLVNKPPRDWNDKDVSAFEVNLHQFARQYQRLVPLAVELGRFSGAGSEVYSVGISNADAQSQEAVLKLASPRDAAKFERQLLSLVDSTVGIDLESKKACLAKVLFSLLTEKPLEAKTPKKSGEDAQQLPLSF